MAELHVFEQNPIEALGYTIARTENVTMLHKYLPPFQTGGYEKAEAQLRQTLQDQGLDPEAVSFAHLPGSSRIPRGIMHTGQGEIFAAWTEHTDDLIETTERPTFRFVQTVDSGSVLTFSITTSILEFRTHLLERLANMAQKGLEYMGKGAKLSIVDANGFPSIKVTKPVTNP